MPASTTPSPPGQGPADLVARVNRRLAEGQVQEAYADVLLAFRQQPAPVLADLLVNAATVGERWEEALTVLADLGSLFQPHHLARCEGVLALGAGYLDQAQRCAERLMSLPDRPDTGMALMVAIAGRQADPAAQLHWMRQRERGLTQIPLSLLPPRWEIQCLLGQHEQVLAEITRLVRAVPAGQVAVHHLLKLQQAMALHGGLRFAESTAIALSLASHLTAHQAPVGDKAMTARINTRRRQSRILAVIERLVLTRGLPVVIHAGTLLGLARDGDLLPGDQDIDLAVMPPATSAQVAETLVSTGDFRPQPHGVDSGGFRALVHQPTGLTVDITEYGREGERFVSRWRHPSGVILREATVPAFTSRLVDVPALGRRLPQPDDPAALLSATYGDWRTPDPCFDTLVAAPNLRGFTAYLGSVAAIRLADNLMAGRTDMARHLAQRLAAHGLARDIAARLTGDGT
ncbi:hypothetical protein [Niveispirillum fermenti]|uniref:hypothetical protein n=1 Tax=Niveispirillum fermenti TaxID=1233113 RepID=UPI003A867708